MRFSVCSTFFEYKNRLNDLSADHSQQCSPARLVPTPHAPTTCDPFVHSPHARTKLRHAESTARFTHPLPHNRSTDPSARRAPFLHQQPTLHFTQPTSIEHPTATNAPPGPPSNTYPMQAILPSTTFTCPPPIDLHALHQSHQSPHPNNLRSHQ